MSLLKLHEYNKVSVRLMKTYSNEIFVEQLKSIKFFDCYTCVNDAHKNFVTKFLSVINFATPIRA